MQKDLEMRLSFDFIIPNKPTARRVAVVGGRTMGDTKRGIHGSQGFFEAAQALGISIIVFDKPGHWLEDEKYGHLREDFIAVDMSNIAGLPQQIVDAVKDREIDGIVTFTDDYVIATAETAEMLGLPTEPAWAMQQAHFKHEMRKMLNNTNIQALHLNNVSQLKDPALAEEFKCLKYPLVVKPIRGKDSKGVKKVTGDANMRQAVRALDGEGLAEHGILLESYVGGPELDANFILWDGQVLFLEVTDNFPCPADLSDSILLNNHFTEEVQISSSGLPPEEIEIIRSSLRNSLLKLGFRSGVFHVEARMQNSSMTYQDARGDGILDLAMSTEGGATTVQTSQPDAFLIELNVRPPGTGGTWSTLYTYGVDMGALQFLRALDDRERFEALSKPFSFSTIGNGGDTQYWTAHCMVPIHHENIRVPDDFFEKVYQALPEIVPHVSRAELYSQSGTVVSPGERIGYFLLYSRTSRRHVLEMYHRAVGVCKKVLDEEI